MDTSPDLATAFVCAMPMELKPLVRRLSLGKVTVDGFSFRSGSVGGGKVVATVTGMGTSRAARGIARLLDAVPVGRVVVVGITGALDEVTPIGTLVVPELVVDGATGEAHRPAPLGGRTAAGTMWTTDELLTGPDVLGGLRERGVVSLDMETAAVAAVCEERGVPWSVVRAVSDRAGDGTVDEEVFRMSNMDGTANAGAVIRYVLRHPGRVPGMARLAKGAKRATEAAADAAIVACSAP